MSKYLRLKADLEATGVGKMTCFGNSMMPILQSGSTLCFEQQEEYEIGDIVFCKVRGRFIDAHKIVAKKAAGNGNRWMYLIANNKGHQNGWTSQVFGKVVFLSTPNS